MFGLVLKYSLGSLAWGVLISAIFVLLFIAAVKGWRRDAVFQPLSMVLLGVVAVIVLWNSTVICGAYSLKVDIETVKLMVEAMVGELPPALVSAPGEYLDGIIRDKLLWTSGLALAGCAGVICTLGQARDSARALRGAPGRRPMAAPRSRGGRRISRI